MRVASAIIRISFVLLAMAALAACDTFGVDFGSPSTPATPAGRAIDYRNDDLTGMIFAIDLPQGVQPLSGGTTATLDATASKGEKHLKATLALADGGAATGLLPPPASGRTYVLLGFSAKDKSALRDLQKWLKAQPDEPVVALDVQPKLCAAGSIDTTTATYGVLPVLPSSALLPIVAKAPLSQLALSGGGKLAAC